MKLTDFGVTGAELTAIAIVLGEQTALLCKMATRAGSLLPDELDRIMISELSKRIEHDVKPRKTSLCYKQQCASEVAQPRSYHYVDVESRTIQTA